MAENFDHNGQPINVKEYTRIEMLFAIPFFRTKRRSGLDSTEKKEIEDIIMNPLKSIEGGMIKNGGEANLQGNWSSKNSYIFDTKLKKLIRKVKKDGREIPY